MNSGLRRQWAIAVALWSIPALLFTVPALREGRSVAQVLLTESVPWLVWALLTPAVLAEARRHPLAPPHRRRDLRRHAALALATGAGYGLFSAVLYHVMGDADAARPFSRTLLESLLGWTPLGAIFYAAIASVGLVLAYQQRLQERDVEAARLEAELSAARLQSLRDQLNPHFLFNTLNTIAMHVRSGETETSVRLLARLSELLRHMLDEGRAAEVPLRTELAYVDRYLEVEAARFADRLRTRICVAEDVRDGLVPNLLLQPLVENAIRHGIARHAAAGRLELRAERLGDRLRIELVNDGAPLPAGFDLASATGLGLHHTAARLAHHYGDAASLVLENQGTAQVAAIVTLPWRT